MAYPTSSSCLITVAVASMVAAGFGADASLELAKARERADHAFDFDMYVMAMSFQPEFCHQHRFKSYGGCEKPLDAWRGQLTIHGLWPQYADGTWPASCSDEPFDQNVLYDLGMDRFERYWPNVKASPGEPGFADFWEHEWSKHGTCSGLDQDDYFRTAMDHAVPTPSLVREHYGGKVLKNELITAYGGAGSVALVCEHGRYLSETRVCLKKKIDHSAGERIECPDTVLAEDSCKEEIVISKFDSDTPKEDMSQEDNINRT